MAAQAPASSGSFTRRPTLTTDFSDVLTPSGVISGRFLWDDGVGWVEAVHRGSWTPETEAELKRRVQAGQFVRQIAAEMGRSQEAVRTGANLLPLSLRFDAKRRQRNQSVLDIAVVPEPTVLVSPSQRS